MYKLFQPQMELISTIRTISSFLFKQYLSLIVNNFATTVKKIALHILVKISTRVNNNVV